MPNKQRSWRELRDQRRKEIFVGRTEYLRLFTQNFSGDTPNYMVFAVTGEGGVGKSTLLGQFRTIAYTPNINANVIICDERYTSPVSAMAYIAGELAKLDITSSKFDERYKKYREILQEVESEGKVPRGALDLITRGLSDLTIKTLRTAPGVGVLLENTDPKAAGEALSQIVNYGISRWGNKDEVQLLREPERILTPLFIDLLNQATEEQKLVLIFDVFERTGETLTPWLLALFDFEYGELGTELTFVISGRDPLDQYWTELAGVICRISLEPFTLDETCIYLTSHGITDPQLVSQIYTDSAGLPVLVELLAATNPKPGAPLADISQDAVARFLQWIPETERRHVALLAAIPRQFNRDILTAALGLDATNDFNWLESQSYIRSNTERGRFYHEKVRELMLRYLRNTTPSDANSVHKRLYTFFSEQQQNLSINTNAPYRSEQWRKLQQEHVYHAISGQPDTQLSVAINTFIYTLRWRRSFAESITAICQQVAEETGRQEIKNIAMQFATLLQLDEEDKYSDVIKYLTHYLNRNDTTTAQRDIYALRGRTYIRTSEYDKAIADYNNAITLDPRDSQLLGWRGKAHLDLEHYEEALADFNQALTLEPQNRLLLHSRIQTYIELKRPTELLSDINQLIALDPKDIAGFSLRALTYSILKRYEEALIDYSYAFTLDPDSPLSLHLLPARGEVYQRLKRYEEALADFNQALTLNPQDLEILRRRGEVYQRLERYEEALADFTQVLTIDPLEPEILRRRGEVYQRLERYEEALADFNQLIALNERHVSWDLLQRGITLIWLEHYEEARANFKQMLGLNERDDDAFAWRGEVFRRQGDYERALSDLDLAVQLNPSSFAFTRRAAAYLGAGNHDAANADIERVKDLLSSNVSDIYNYAVTLVLSHNYEQAIKMLSDAIGLDAIARSYARADDLFDPIRNTIEFQELMRST